MKLTMMLAGAAFAVSAVSAPATAAIVIVTYTGTVSSGYDQTGEFGVANTDLTGERFIAKYVFDTTKGYYNNSAYDNRLYGNTGNNPLVSSNITIGGNSIALASSYSGALYQYNDGTSSRQTSNGETYQDSGDYFFQQLYTSVDSSSNVYPAMYGKYSGPVVGNFNGYFDDVAIPAGSNQYSKYAYAYFNATNLTIGTGAVPEPATWAMMLLGFAVIGCAARKRSSVKTSVAAA